MSHRVRIAAALTRAWVRLYTIRMPADLGETRRAELEADLWDHAADAQQNGVPAALAAMEILLRACLGIPDDLSWRFEAIQARRANSQEWRRPMMALSARQTRWMGLCLLLGGLLWAVDIMYFVRNDPHNPLRSYVFHIPASALCIVGVVGRWAQQRGRAGKAATAGFILLLTSCVAWFMLHMLGVFGFSGKSLAANLLALAWVFLLPPAFLCLGIGLTGAARIVPLAVFCAGSVLNFLPRLLTQRVLTHYFPSVTNWSRGDSPGSLTVFFLVAIGLAVMGYSGSREAATGPGTDR